MTDDYILAIARMDFEDGAQEISFELRARYPELWQVFDRADDMAELVANAPDPDDVEALEDEARDLRRALTNALTAIETACCHISPTQDRAAWEALTAQALALRALT
tara:strand:+ start:1138 stop:1458 length:321 start_codon:yes stop_codon:yes gene_type:complete